jgi:pilus assembly protein Flp/PilA
MKMFNIKDRERSAVIPGILSCFFRDERGATAIEYAIIASGIAVAIAASVTSLGSSVNNLFTSVSTAFK